MRRLRSAGRPGRSSPGETRRVGVNSRRTRRAFLGAALAGRSVSTVSAQVEPIEEKGRVMKGEHVRSERKGTVAAREGRLLARPENHGGAGPIGLHPLDLAEGRDGLIYVPSGYRADRPAPVVLLLHGAGSDAGHGVGLLRGLADEAGLILLAPASRRRTWDVILDGFGPDVGSIDRALGRVFRDHAVDPGRLVVGGFSDGASYALSLGLTNGDLFTHVVAFSPGFMAPRGLRGKPRLFLSHGTHDAILPIERCSRRIEPQLRRAGYDVTYREFDGPHTVPTEIAREAVDWFGPR